jgi:biopolymer transport protein TolR
VATVHAPAGGRKKRRLNAEINVVPYIDVMLVLLVIFMVTAPLLTQGVDVELPQTSSNPLTQEDQPVTLTVDGGGRYFLDVGKGADKPVSEDELSQLVHAVMDQKPDRMILVRADSHVSYDKVVRGMSLLQGAGARKIGFVTDAVAAGKTGKRNP